MGGTNQPFSVPLEAVELKLLHCDNHPSAWFHRCKRALIHPSLEDRAKASLPEQAVRSEVPCGAFQLTEGELSDI